MDFKEKYLKYKQKYIKLKNLIGGEYTEIIEKYNTYYKDKDIIINKENYTDLKNFILEIQEEIFLNKNATKKTALEQCENILLQLKIRYVFVTYREFMFRVYNALPFIQIYRNFTIGEQDFKIEPKTALSQEDSDILRDIDIMIAMQKYIKRHLRSLIVNLNSDLETYLSYKEKLNKIFQEIFAQDNIIDCVVNINGNTKISPFKYNIDSGSKNEFIIDIKRFAEIYKIKLVKYFEDIIIDYTTNCNESDYSNYKLKENIIHNIYSEIDEILKTEKTPESKKKVDNEYAKISEHFVINKTKENINKIERFKIIVNEYKTHFSEDKDESKAHEIDNIYKEFGLLKEISKQQKTEIQKYYKEFEEVMISKFDAPTSVILQKSKAIKNKNKGEHKQDGEKDTSETSSIELIHGEKDTGITISDINGIELVRKEKDTGIISSGIKHTHRERKKKNKIDTVIKQGIPLKPIDVFLENIAIFEASENFDEQSAYIETIDTIFEHLGNDDKQEMEKEYVRFLKIIKTKYKKIIDENKSILANDAKSTEISLNPDISLDLLSGISLFPEIFDADSEYIIAEDNFESKVKKESLYQNFDSASAHKIISSKNLQTKINRIITILEAKPENEKIIKELRDLYRCPVNLTSPVLLRAVSSSLNPYYIFPSFTGYDERSKNNTMNNFIDYLIEKVDQKKGNLKEMVIEEFKTSTFSDDISIFENNIIDITSNTRYKNFNITPESPTGTYITFLIFIKSINLVVPCCLSFHKETSEHPLTKLLTIHLGTIASSFPEVDPNQELSNIRIVNKGTIGDKINFFNRDILEGKIRLNLEYIDQSSDSIGNIYYNLTTTKRGDMRLLDDMRLLPKFREYLEEKILYHIFSKIIKIIGQD